MGDQAAYIGPIGAGSIAKLVHNCTSAVLGLALAEVFTMGVKAGVDPVAPWRTASHSSSGSTPALIPIVKTSASAMPMTALVQLCTSLAIVPAPIGPI